VKKRTESGRSPFALVPAVAFLFFLGGCAVSERGTVAQKPAARGERVTVREEREARSDTMSRKTPYNIEDEMPERAPQKPVQLVERIEPVKPDTFNVQDIDGGEKPKQLYDVGYRIQVFASNDKAAAEKVKQRVVTATGMPAYLEYEEGLYKVRAGDFAERKDAAQARLKLMGLYPGSWIVRTTIRKPS